ncbi:hypothetical protein [Nocardioides sp.]|uniref:hypothetical protein n=1 Tax=Nocardioides sp. TaxID=35761 RepID=UPI00273280AC|nr:hypothetical protein [Nocardioides sp.]MDP3894409.1 hypothetical protein [Nocardioides sp.]
MTDQRLPEIQAALEESPVYLGPGTGGWLGEAEATELARIIDEADLPLRIVLVLPGEGIHSADDLLVRLHDAGAPDALYVGVNNVWERDPGGTLAFGSDQLNLAVKQWGEVAGSGDLVRSVETFLSYGEGPGDSFDFGPGLVTLAERLTAGDVEGIEADGREGLQLSLEASEAEREETGSGTGSTGATTPDRSPGSGDEPELGAGMIVVALAIIVVAAVVISRRRAAQARAAAPFTLPDSAVDRIRDAEAGAVRQRAATAITRLGEAIDTTAMRGAADSVWQAALDHYEAAGRLLPADQEAAVHLLDAVGALVLAERGEEALAAARSGSPFRPTTRCFLNPLHGTGSGERPMSHGRFQVTGPLCRDCRRHLDAGRRPDILDVMYRGRPEHYFETGREPWASTGFGALEPDLITRLRRRSR